MQEPTHFHVQFPIPAMVQFDHIGVLYPSAELKEQNVEKKYRVNFPKATWSISLMDPD